MTQSTLSLVGEIAPGRGATRNLADGGAVQCLVATVLGLDYLVVSTVYLTRVSRSSDRSFVPSP
jgi:hypothetical protein